MKNSTKWIILAIACAMLGLVVVGGVGLFIWWRFSAVREPVGSPPATQTSADRWSETLNQPATVKVLKMSPVPLVVGTGKESWTQVPDFFQRNAATIHMPAGRGDGVAEYEVITGGYVFVACNYSNQGNRSGGWHEERWTQKDFADHGWEEISTADLGGKLVKNGPRTQVVFVKKMTAGEQGRLRCNKYDPPYFISVQRGGRN